MRFKLMNEGGLSRIWQYVQDDRTFTIIGSEDKDTKEDKSELLREKVNKLASKNLGKIGYKYLYGQYTYPDGEIARELSVIIFNLTREQALEFARGARGNEDPEKFLNQQEIVWKDKDFFGLLDVPTKEERDSFVRDKFDFSNVEEFSSRLVGNKRKNQLKPFNFKLEHYVSKKGYQSSARNMAINENLVREVLLDIDL